MSLLRNIASGLQSLHRRKHLDRELNDELATYSEMAVADKVNQSMSSEEARRVVRLEQGTVEVAREIVSAASWESFVETLSQDLRFAARTLLYSTHYTGRAVRPH